MAKKEPNSRYITKEISDGNKNTIFQTFVFSGPFCTSIWMCNSQLRKIRTAQKSRNYICTKSAISCTHNFWIFEQFQFSSIVSYISKSKCKKDQKKRTFLKIVILLPSEISFTIYREFSTFLAIFSNFHLHSCRNF